MQDPQDTILAHGTGGGNAGPQDPSRPIETPCVTHLAHGAKKSSTTDLNHYYHKKYVAYINCLGTPLDNPNKST